MSYGTRLDRAPSPPPPKRHHPRQPVPRIGPVNSEAWELLKRSTPEQIKAASWIGLTTGEQWRALEWLVDGGPLAPARDSAKMDTCTRRT